MVWKQTVLAQTDHLPKPSRGWLFDAWMRSPYGEVNHCLSRLGSVLDQLSLFIPTVRLVPAQSLVHYAMYDEMNLTDKYSYIFHFSGFPGFLSVPP